ncbi:hypothetical protein BC567DRAFT_227284 [Phyllosticta citribraziliensis]
MLRLGGNGIISRPVKRLTPAVLLLTVVCLDSSFDLEDTALTTSQFHTLKSLVSRNCGIITCRIAADFFVQESLRRHDPTQGTPIAAHNVAALIRTRG